MTISTFTELWTELKQDAEAAVSAVKADLVALEHSIVPVIEADLVFIFNQLKGVAVQSVLELAGSALSGREKLSTVVTTVFQHAEANAIQIGLDDARLLAQQAYNAVAAAVGKAQ